MTEEEKIQQKRDKEQQIVTLMIQIYCHSYHRTRKAMRSPEYMCEECKDLARYSSERSQKCPFIAKGTKTFCSFCKVHCYKPEYREKIRQVMRYSGPRMMLYRPVKAIRHLILTLHQKNQIKREEVRVKA